jgi:hypothetical protein
MNSSRGIIPSNSYTTPAKVIAPTMAVQPPVHMEKEGLSGWRPSPQEAAAAAAFRRDRHKQPSTTPTATHQMSTCQSCDGDAGELLQKPSGHDSSDRPPGKKTQNESSIIMGIVIVDDSSAHNHNKNRRASNNDSIPNPSSTATTTATTTASRLTDDVDDAKPVFGIDVFDSGNGEYAVVITRDYDTASAQYNPFHGDRYPGKSKVFLATVYMIVKGGTVATTKQLARCMKSIWLWWLRVTVPRRCLEAAATTAAPRHLLLA